MSEIFDIFTKCSQKSIGSEIKKMVKTFVLFACVLCCLRAVVCYDSFHSNTGGIKSQENEIRLVDNEIHSLKVQLELEREERRVLQEFITSKLGVIEGRLAMKKPSQSYQYTGLYIIQDILVCNN